MFVITFIPRICFKVTLHWEISHYKILAELHEKLKKLYNARSYLNSEVRNTHKHITDDIDWLENRAKIERLVFKLKSAIGKLVQKNEEYLDLASKNR